MQIRLAKRGEAQRLTTIAKAAKAHWGYPQAWLESWDTDLTITEAYLADAVVLVATCDEDQAQAFFAASQADKTWELDHAWVHPKSMGGGLGRALFEQMLEQIKDRGPNTLEILSDPNAAPFYERLGAVKVKDVASNQTGRTLPLYRYSF